MRTLRDLLCRTPARVRAQRQATEMREIRRQIADLAAIRSTWPR